MIPSDRIMDSKIIYRTLSFSLNFKKYQKLNNGVYIH